MSDWTEIMPLFREALIRAYTWNRLGPVVWQYGNRRLDVITSESEGFAKNVDDVIDDAVRYGWLEDLAQGALELNPEHTGLKETVPQIVQGVEAGGTAYYQSSMTVPPRDPDPGAEGQPAGGGNIVVGDITGAAGVAIGPGASATVSNVTIGAVPAADDTAQKDLDRLVRQLNALLQEAPVGQKSEADAVAQSTQMLLDSASVEKPNTTLVQTMGTVLQQSAQVFADNLPQVVDIVGKIALAATAVAKAAG